MLQIKVVKGWRGKQACLSMCLSVRRVGIYSEKRKREMDGVMEKK